MSRKYVFVESDPGVLEDEYDVGAKFDFGSAGGAALVNEDIEDISHKSILDVESEDIDFTTNDIGVVQSHDTATPEDVKDVHHITNATYTGDGVTVVAMDSGVDDRHPVFFDKQIEHADVTGYGKGDEVGHGTAVAGQIAQHSPDAELISLRIFGGQGRSSLNTILRAYEWLFSNANRIDVVNMSWGASRKVDQIDRLQNELSGMGVTCIAAAGNSGGPGGSPATAKSSISAAAITKTREVAPFSSYDKPYDNPDVAAIGVNNKLAKAHGTSMGDILDREWVKASGTSFAAPILSACVARYIESGKEENIVATFEKNADDIEGTKEDGAGSLNNDRIYKSMNKTPLGDGTVWTMWSNGNDMIHINKNWLDDGEYEVEKHEQDDSTVLILNKK